MEKILLRPVEAAEVIGVSRSAIYKLIASGDIPCVRVGTSVRVPVDRLREWIENKVEQGRQRAEPAGINTGETDPMWPAEPPLDGITVTKTAKVSFARG